MSWQELTLGLLDALAWPVTVLIGLWCTRKLLAALGQRIHRDLQAGSSVKLSGGGFGVELADVDATWNQPFDVNEELTIHTTDPDDI